MSSKQPSRSLPDTWELNTLESLLAVSIGGIWGVESGLSEVNVDVVRVTELKAHGFIEPSTAAKRSITRKQFQSRALEVGDLLLEKSGGGPNTPVGRVGYVLSIDKPMVCSNFMQLMRPDAKKVFPKYLHFFLTFIHSNGETIAMQTSTTNIRNIKTPEYMAVNVPVPSLQEQGKIVEILEEQLSRLDAALTSVRAVREKSARFRRSLLHVAFIGALTSHDRAAGMLPSGWSTVRLGDCLEKLKSGKLVERGWSPQCLSQPSSDEDTWGVLKTTAVQMGDYWAEFNKELPKSLEPKTGLEVNDGDFLMTTTGPRNRCGIVCLVNQTRKKLIFSGKILRFRADTSRLMPGWLMYLMMSPDIQKTFDEMKVGTSDSSVSIGNQQVLDLIVPITPLDEQKKTLEILEAQFSRLEASLALADAIEKKASALRRSLLHAAFSGNLTKEWREGAYV
jgi:type I restriction enzyme S subunit